ncbi:hypothetical protein HZC09_00835 [Candidatus Micrarchaeota archaeon]|nr:hypothetical protein [Candidatus Micrarchaeota archaeon]
MRFLLLALILAPLAAAGVQYSVADQSTCSCDFATFILHAENTGEEKANEVLTITSEAGVYPKTIDVSLSPGEKRDYFVTAQACDAGSKKITFSGRKQFSAALSTTACEAFQLIVTAQQSACTAQQAAFNVEVRNIGRNAQNISLETDLSEYIMPKSVYLAPWEKKSVPLIVNTPTVPQRLPFKVTAYSETGREEETTLLQLSSCEGLSLKAPEKIDVQINTTVTSRFSITNEGKARMIEVKAACPDFVEFSDFSTILNSSETRSFELSMRSSKPGEYTCTIFAKPEGEAKTYAKTIVISVFSPTPIISVSPVFFEVEKDVETPITFTIRNTGAQTTLRTSLEANASVYTAGKNLTLKTSEERKLTYVVKAANTTKSKLRLGNETHGFELRAIEPVLTINASAHNTSEGVRIDYVFTNLGNATSLNIASEPIMQGPAKLEIPARSQLFASYLLPENVTEVTLAARTADKTYSYKLSVPEEQSPSAQTGFVVAASTPVMAFGAAILLALLIIYFSRRPPKQEQKKITMYAERK